jgi:hypothetical protein
MEEGFSSATDPVLPSDFDLDAFEMDDFEM